MTRTTVILLAGALWLWASAGCATVNISEDREKAFNQSVEALASDDNAVAARAAWAYLDGASKDDPRYDRALRLIAVASEELDLSYVASLWYLDIAEGKRDPELVPKAVRGLERIVMGGPHDEQTLVRGFLSSAEFAELPPDVQPFVDYMQGLDSMRHGLDEWADKRLEAIPKKSRYYWWAQYAKVVREIARGNLKTALQGLQAMVDDEEVELPKKLSEEVYRALARLYFEGRAFDKALEQYQKLRELAPEDPGLLVEMAWAHYYTGDSRRALGLLLALDAPVYSDLIAPERYLLEALALRRLCQFSPARQAATRLQTQYGAALDDLHSGVPLMKSEALKAAARRRGVARKLAEFRRRLERERAIVEEMSGSFGEKLTKALEELYAHGIAEALRREEAVLKDEVVHIAEELLQAEEGVRLIVHELSVALLRGRRRPSGVQEADPVEIKATGDKAFFKFKGEFWTDELDDLVVVLEDRCID